MKNLRKNKIYSGNNVPILKTFPDDCIDLVVTSPPYDDLRFKSELFFDFEGLANELYRVMKKGGVVVWVVRDATQFGSETGTSFKQALYFREIGFRIHDTMIYKKKSRAYHAHPGSVRYTDTFEYMFVFSKGRPKSVNLIRDRKNAGSGTSGYTNRLDNTGTRKKNPEKYEVAKMGYRLNIWEISYTGKKDLGDGFSISDHHSVFPENLARDHILSWSNKKDVVLDPMCGSGTTLYVAKKFKRKFIGIDVVEKFCKLSAKRCDCRIIDCI